MVGVALPRFLMRVSHLLRSPKNRILDRYKIWQTGTVKGEECWLTENIYLEK